MKPIQIDLEIKYVYGTERLYPMNDAANKFAMLLGRKTLTREDVKTLRDIGLVIKFIATIPKELL